MKKIKYILFALLLCSCNMRNQNKDIRELKQQYQQEYNDPAYTVEIRNIRYLGRDEERYENTIYVYDYYQYDLFIFNKKDGYTKMYFELDKIFKKQTTREL